MNFKEDDRFEIAFGDIGNYLIDTVGAPKFKVRFSRKVKDGSVHGKAEEHLKSIGARVSGLQDNVMMYAGANTLEEIMQKLGKIVHAYNIAEYECAKEKREKVITKLDAELSEAGKYLEEGEEDE